MKPDNAPSKNTDPFTKKDDQAMASIARVTLNKIDFGRRMCECNQFDNPFFKAQCISVFNDLTEKNILSHNLYDYFQLKHPQILQKNEFFKWLKSFATRNHKKRFQNMNKKII